jgi:hypothetical protein
VAADAPARHRERLPAFRAAAADLGAGSAADLPGRAQPVSAFLPRLAAAAGAVVAADPDVAR